MENKTYPRRVDGKITKEYRAWKSMKARCYAPCNKLNHNKHYQLKNIQVCDEWKNSFDCFMNDMGYAPSEKYSLDRIDNNKGYCKENCRWVTFDVQAKNRGSFNILITYNNKTMVLKDWAREYGVEYTVLRRRLKRGLSFEKAISEDPNDRLHTYNEKTQTVGEWCKEVGITRSLFYDRKHRGWSIEKILTTKHNKI